MAFIFAVHPLLMFFKLYVKHHSQEPAFVHNINIDAYKKKMKAFFLPLLILYGHISGHYSAFWVKVVNHIMMKVMPLLFFLCNKHKDSMISLLFSRHIPKDLHLYYICTTLHVELQLVISFIVY